MMRHDISGGVWESKRAVITKLYKEEEWPLKHVIRVIQTDTFRPSETQLRARLKKWHVTKPSRKKYCSGKAASTETTAHDKLLPPFDLTQTRDDGSIPIDPTPKPTAATPPHDLDHLDSLNSALDDYLRASCLLPTTNKHSSPFSTTSTSTAHDGSLNAPMRPYLEQRVSPEDRFQATSKKTAEQSSSTEMQHTCVCLGHASRMGTIVPKADSYNESLTQEALPSTNPITEREPEAWMTTYDPESRWLAHMSPLEQYQTGLALCQHAFPRLTQQDRCVLGFHTNNPNEQHGPGNLPLDSCEALPLSLSQAHIMGSASLRPCLVCLDFPPL